MGGSNTTGSDLIPGQLGLQYISDVSSRGPTANGRRKPEIVAPGKYILSVGARPDRVRECDEGIPSAVGRGGKLLSVRGTYMATPVVSGTSAQLYQYFEECWYPMGGHMSGDTMTPTGSLVKAVLLNGVQTNMIGVDNGSSGITPVSPYDNNIGFV